MKPTCKSDLSSATFRSVSSKRKEADKGGERYDDSTDKWKGWERETGETRKGDKGMEAIKKEERGRRTFSFGRLLC
jgi:hypothetical protein